jgi:hypothetical protein
MVEESYHSLRDVVLWEGRRDFEWIVGNTEVGSRVASLNFSTDGLPVKRAQSTTSNHAVDLALLLAENEIPWMVATLLAA